jgi:hypothetical protein
MPTFVSNLLHFVRGTPPALNGRIDRQCPPFYDDIMSSIEFETELRGEPTLTLPSDVIARLPKSGRATIVVHVQDDAEDSEWRKASYEQFMKDDGPEDAVYDALQ